MRLEKQDSILRSENGVVDVVKLLGEKTGGMRQKTGIFDRRFYERIWLKEGCWATDDDNDNTIYFSKKLIHYMR